LTRLLPAQPVYGLPSPERPEADLRALAALHLEAVRQAQPAGPYRLLGWSMGGVVAYEMACQLAAAGEEVELLAVVDSPSPLFWREAPAPTELEMVAAF